MQIRNVCSCTIVLNKKIEAQATITDEGVVVTVAGGDHSHVGSVSIVDHEGMLECKRFEGHMDDVVGDKWALSFYELCRVPVVVTAGIHYDHLPKERLRHVINACDRLLKDMLVEIHDFPRNATAKRTNYEN